MAQQASVTNVADTPGGAASDRSDESFRFLDLPAELRNAVYQACAQDVTEDPVDRKRRCWILSRSQRRWSEIYTSQFFELTQVCSQIRQEFRSMCLASTPKWFHIDNFDSYTKVFHPDDEVADTIVLDMQRLAGKFARRVDLLKTFFHLSRHANVACTFETTYDIYGRGQSLLDLCRILTRSAEHAPTTDWNDAASKLVSVIPKTTNKNLVITVKREHKGRGVQRKDFEAYLCSKLGLRSEGKWSVVVKYD